MMSQPRASLQTLSTEIIEHNVLPAIADLSSLAHFGRTSRFYHDLVTNHGYRGYMQQRYPDVYAHQTLPSDWRSVLAHVVKNDRLWDDREFSMRGVHMDDYIKRTTWSRDRTAVDSQSMGYRPVLAVRGNGLAIGGGSNVYRTHDDGETWTTYTAPTSSEGAADDIFGLHILGDEGMIVARANGKVQRFGVEGDVLYDFQASKQTLTSSSLSGDLLAITTKTKKDGSILLCRNATSANDSEPLERPLTAAALCSSFLSPTLLAVGHTDGFDMLTITPHSIINAPFLTPDCHALIPLSTSLFAAGFHDGVTRIFDIRTPVPSIAMEFVDDTKYSNPIYALASVYQTIIAGTSDTCELQVYDMRNPDAPNGISINAKYGASARQNSTGSVYSLAVKGNEHGGTGVYVGLESRVVEMLVGKDNGDPLLGYYSHADVFGKTEAIREEIIRRHV